MVTRPDNIRPCFYNINIRKKGFNLNQTPHQQYFKFETKEDFIKYINIYF